MKSTQYQPKTGAPCHCKRGVQRDNCPACEGTGMRIDFVSIRARPLLDRLRHHVTGAIERGEAKPIIEITVENNNCDGSGPHSGPQVRTLPTGGDSNAILCRSCYEREIKWRMQRNHDLEASAHFDLPTWSALKVYPQE